MDRCKRLYQLVCGGFALLLRQLTEQRTHGLPAVVHGAPRHQDAVVGVAGILLGVGGSLVQLGAQVGGHTGGHFLCLPPHLFLVHHRRDGLAFQGVVLGLEFVCPQGGGAGHLPGAFQLLLRVLCVLLGLFALAPRFLLPGFGGIGALLLDGIGDTIRVSLAAEPEKEVEAGFNILRAVGFPVTGPEVITCPTCGRTQYPCTEIANEVEKRLQGYKKSIKVAVMGCVVNGPGEAREADIGIAGGKGEAVLFIHGQPIKKLTGDNILDQFMDEIYKL